MCGSKVGIALYKYIISFFYDINVEEYLVSHNSQVVLYVTYS